MFKGLCICYAVIASTYFSVGVSGYWSFGNQAQPTIVSNFMGDGQPLLPTWFLLLTNLFTLMQVAAISLVSSIPYHLQQSCILFSHVTRASYCRFTCNPQTKFSKSGLRTQRWINSPPEMLYRGWFLDHCLLYSLPFWLPCYLSSATSWRCSEHLDAFLWISFCQWSSTMSHSSHRRRASCSGGTPW